MKRIILFLLNLAIIQCIFAQCPTDSILYVDASASGADDGTNWTDAYTDFQDALDIADMCPIVTTIYVAKGVYRPSKATEMGNPLSNTFYISRDLKIYGGFLGGESGPDERPKSKGKLNKTHYAVLNGDLARNDEYNADSTRIKNIFEIDSLPDNVIHVVTIEGVSNQMVLDGFVMTGGHAHFDGGAKRKKQGGGLYIKGDVQACDPVIRNCFFRTNIAQNAGGALLTFGDVAPQFINCQFLINTSYLNGGAVFNSAEGGFENRSVFKNCEFEGNEALFSAGVIYNRATLSDGICDPIFIQCIFNGNKAVNAGVVYSIVPGTGSTDATFLNCLFAGNEPTVLRSHGPASMIRVYNSILYGNELDGDPPYEATNGGQLDIQYSNIQDIVPTGSNYNYDPFYINPTNASIPNTKGNYQPDPCVAPTDLGSDSLYTSITSDSLDYDLNPRFVEGHGVGSNTNPSMIPIDLGPWEIPSPILFTATKDSNDAYIDLHWEVLVDECNCFDEDPVLKRGITVQLKSGVQLIASWEVFKEEIDGGVYSFDYRDPVGPDITKDYTLEFKKTGPGTLNCQQIERGSTLPFAPVELLSLQHGNRPNWVNSRWINHSTLTDQLKLFRNGILIATIDAGNELGKEHFYRDEFSFTDPNSFVNGSVDTYCIQTISDIYTDIYGTPVPQQTCGIGSSRDIDLQASDNTFTDKVVLTWKNMSPFCDHIRIVRDGELIGVVEKNKKSFEDLMPIYGKNCLYGVELVKDEKIIVGHYDEGMVPTNGVIAGKVLTGQLKVPVQNVKIVLSWTQADTVQMKDSTTTDAFGEFAFQDLYYGKSNTFTLTASKDSQEFEVNPLTAELSLSDGQKEDFIFLMRKNLIDSNILNINITFSAVPDHAADLVNLNWQFQKNNANDTVFFNLYRESDLIEQRVDVQQTTGTIHYAMEDLTGVPDMPYIYTLIAYTRSNTEITDTALASSVQFPSVTSVAALNAVPVNALGKVNLDWTHTSSNFSGFRLYRQTGAAHRIFEGSTSDLSFVDENGIPGISTGYVITAFRNVNGVDYESMPSDILFVNYPALTPINITTATPRPAKDVVRLRYTIPGVYTPDYAYEGIRIIRSKAGNEVVLATIDKSLLPVGIEMEFNDDLGIPQTLYTYSVRPYVISSGSTYEGIGNSLTRTFPAVSIPVNLQAIAYEGKIALHWRSPPLASENTDGLCYLQRN